MGGYASLQNKRRELGNSGDGEQDGTKNSERGQAEGAREKTTTLINLIHFTTDTIIKDAAGGTAGM